VECRPAHDGATPAGQLPVLREEWPLPKVSPAPGTREIFEDQVRLGVSYD